MSLKHINVTGKESLTLSSSPVLISQRERARQERKYGSCQLVQYLLKRNNQLEALGCGDPGCVMHKCA